MIRNVPDSFVANDGYVLGLKDFRLAYVSPPEARFANPASDDHRLYRLALKASVADIGAVRGFLLPVLSGGARTFAIGPRVYMMWFERPDDPTKVTFLSDRLLMDEGAAKGTLHRMHARAEYEGLGDARWIAEAYDSLFGMPRP